MNKKRSVLVVFDGEVSQGIVDKYDEVICGTELEKYIEVESINEANAFLQELSRARLPDETLVTKSFMYKGYELWWIHYHDLFQYFCLPYTRYRRLLIHLSSFKKVHLYNTSCKNLFLYYLQTKGARVEITDSKFRAQRFLPFGVFIQACLNIFFLPALIIRRPKILLYTGDNFDKGKDYDFRMKFVYEELRKRRLHFFESIRSLESWKKVIKHSFIRKRSVVYTESVFFLAKFISLFTNNHTRVKNILAAYRDMFCGDDKFRFMVATHYLMKVNDDIWAIRLMGAMLKIIDIKVAIVPTANERNFHTVIACKVSNVPIVGILHGAASKNYNVYDFMPSFDGDKVLSVDKYGVWSEWWKNYYEKYSDAYKADQLFVSGPIRPLTVDISKSRCVGQGDRLLKVLFVPGELSDPKEVMPYIRRLMQESDIDFYLTFRPYRDKFEDWLKNNDRNLIEKIGKEHILLGNIRDAIAQTDIVVGSYSTAVLEATLVNRPFVFFNTKKWGDYFDISSYDTERSFFAENPEELVIKVHKAIFVPDEIIADLQYRFFGDPKKNGSKWVVDEVEKVLQRN